MYNLYPVLYVAQKCLVLQKSLGQSLKVKRTTWDYMNVYSRNIAGDYVDSNSCALQSLKVEEIREELYKDYERSHHLNSFHFETNLLDIFMI